MELSHPIGSTLSAGVCPMPIQRRGGWNFATDTRGMALHRYHHPPPGLQRSAGVPHFTTSRRSVWNVRWFIAKVGKHVSYPLPVITPVTDTNSSNWHSTEFHLVGSTGCAAPVTSVRAPFTPHAMFGNFSRSAIRAFKLFSLRVMETVECKSADLCTLLL